MRPSASGLIRLATGIAGVVVAHGLVYQLAHRDPVARESAMASTGHAHWDLIALGGLIAAGLALLVAAMGRLASADRGWRFRGRDMVLQAGALMGLEVIERLTTTGWGTLAADPVVILSVPVAVAVALVAALLVRAAHRVGRALAAWASGFTVRLVPTAVRASDSHCAAVGIDRVAAARGPPALSYL